MEKKSRNQNLLDMAIETGEINGYKYFIAGAPMEGALNGYIIFPKKPVIENDYFGILVYVPVHGGITYCEHDELGSVYGFDTLHYDSEELPRTDPAWIKEQIGYMLQGILKAAEVERNYLRCTSNKGKAKWAQMVQDIQPEQASNFGVSINLLTGSL